LGEPKVFSSFLSFLVMEESNDSLQKIKNFFLKKNLGSTANLINKNYKV
jgi:hypothetical protein